MLVNLRTSWGHQVRNLFSSLQPFPFPREMNSGLLDMYAIVKSAENKLSVVQNRCLGKIAGAYKATPVRSLEAETYISPISLCISTHHRLRREKRLRSNSQASLIAKACKGVAYKLGVANEIGSKPMAALSMSKEKKKKSSRLLMARPSLRSIQQTNIRTRKHLLE